MAQARGHASRKRSGVIPEHWRMPQRLCPPTFRRSRTPPIAPNAPPTKAVMLHHRAVPASAQMTPTRIAPRPTAIHAQAVLSTLALSDHDRRFAMAGRAAPGTATNTTRTSGISTHRAYSSGVIPEHWRPPAPSAPAHTSAVRIPDRFLREPGEPLGEHPCPACRFLTLTESPPGTYQICAICGWEDDLVQFDDPDYRGGANGPSLNEWRAIFEAEGLPSLVARDFNFPPRAQ